MNDLSILSGSEITAALPLEQNPAAVYLASLTPTGRRSQAVVCHKVWHCGHKVWQW